MDKRRVSLLSMLSIMAAMPAMAQEATSAGRIVNPVKPATPDFSGIWGHLFWPDVDPPLSGPGPVVNRARLPNGVSNPTRLIGDYTNPVLKPQAAEIVKQRGDMQVRGETPPTPSNQCWPGGVPFIFWNIGIELLQKPDEITIVYAYNNEVRHVRIDQSHAADITPSWYGDSVGHYEDDTLVIDTVGVRIGPFAMTDMYGTPYTKALHVVERYRLIDYEAAKEAQDRAAKFNFRLPVTDWGWLPDPDYKGKGLELRFTVEDTGAFTTPWSATVTYRRPRGDWPEYICAESRDMFPGHAAAVPAAAQPDF